MIKTINKNFLILMALFTFASFIRILLDNTPWLDNGIAFINIISLLYVIYLLFEDSGNHLNSLLIDNQIIGEQIKQRKRKYFRKKVNAYSIFLLIIGIIYSFFLANSIANDIIAMIALFLSIQSNYIATSIANYLNRKK